MSDPIILPCKECNNEISLRIEDAKKYNSKNPFVCNECIKKSISEKVFEPKRKPFIIPDVSPDRISPNILPYDKFNPNIPRIGNPLIPHQNDPRPRIGDPTPYPNDPFFSPQKKKNDKDRTFYYDINTNSKFQSKKDANMFLTKSQKKYEEGMSRSFSSWSKSVHSSGNYLTSNISH